MFQLKMYMAIRGRAPARGLQAHRRQLLSPRLSRKPVWFRLYLMALNERLAPGAVCCSVTPLRAGTHLDGLVQSNLSGTGGHMRTLAPHLPTSSSVWVDGDIKEQGASFTSQPFWDQSHHFLYCSGSLEPNSRAKPPGWS